MRCFHQPQSDAVDTLESIMMNLWEIAKKFNWDVFVNELIYIFYIIKTQS